MNKFFKRKEFACKCGCGFDPVDAELLEVLTDIRLYFNSPVIITSGCRCTEHNKTIGGSDKSMHVFGKAADIQVKNVLPQDVALYLGTKYFDKYGLGVYSNWVHIDVREGKARWQD